MGEEEEQALIPGLPDDIALDCLARIPHRFHPGIRPVCRKWRDLVTAPSFHNHRDQIGVAEDLIFLVQALKGEGEEVSKLADPVTGGELKEEEETKNISAVNSRPPVYSLCVYNATLATWHRVATSDAIPMFSQCSAVGGKVVLVGGWDPLTLDPVSDVRILDPTTMTWRQGKPMTSARSFFACAAVNGKVYVAGGHDGQKNALRSAEAYDVGSDEWVSLPPMAEERDESKGLSLGGKFWAVSGYGTETQGRFDTSAEWYDTSAGEWKREEGLWGEMDGGGGATCAACFGVGERMWSLDVRGAREYEGSEKGWRVVGPAPEGMRSSTCGAVIGRGEKVFVTGGDGNGVWLAEVGSRKWIRVETPVGFSGFVYSAAAVRI